MGERHPFLADIENPVTSVGHIWFGLPALKFRCIAFGTSGLIFLCMSSFSLHFCLLQATHCSAWFDESPFQRAYGLLDSKQFWFYRIHISNHCFFSVAQRSFVDAWVFLEHQSFLSEYLFSVTYLVVFNSPNSCKVATLPSVGFPPARSLDGFITAAAHFPIKLLRRAWMPAVLYLTSFDTDGISSPSVK